MAVVARILGNRWGGRSLQRVDLRRLVVAVLVTSCHWHHCMASRMLPLTGVYRVDLELGHGARDWGHQPMAVLGK